MNSNKEKQDFFVEGKIVISSEVHPFEKGIAHISLIDTTNQDIEAVALAESTISDIQHKNEETILDFRLEIVETEHVNPNNDYSVQVWIDTNGNGKPEAGDLFTDRQYPVLTHDFGNNLTVRFDED